MVALAKSGSMKMKYHGMAYQQSSSGMAAKAIMAKSQAAWHGGNNNGVACGKQQLKHLGHRRRHISMASNSGAAA